MNYFKMHTCGLSHSYLTTFYEIWVDVYHLQFIDKESYFHSRAGTKMSV